MRTKAWTILTAALLLSTATWAAATTTKHGDPITSQSAPLPVATVIERAAQYQGKTVLVEGKVRAACSRKGCWMELAPTSAKGTQGCRVTFKGYSFFVPIDSAGATARVEGVVTVRDVSSGEVEHLESEGAVFANKAADGSAKEVRIVASGVELKK
jgi:hypothetical protein